MQRALPTGKGEVLLNFADGMPAMGTAESGLGTAILCNFAPSELASNIARQRLFPAWMQDMVLQLKPETLADSAQETGGNITAELWLQDLANAPIQDPHKAPVTSQTSVDGERISATFPAPLPGLYAQGPEGKRNWVQAVNLPEEEADLRGIDPSELARRSETGAGRVGEFVNGAQDYAELNTGRPLFHWFVLAAAAVFALEMLLIRPFLRAAGHVSS